MSSDNPDVCTFFLNGGCLYGATCNFLHPQDWLIPEPTQPTYHDMKPGYNKASHQYYTSKEVPRASPQKPQSRQTCWYILENGWCQFGNNCRYSHEIPVNWLKNPPSKSVCVYFQRGNCYRGSNCNFVHPQAGDQDEQGSAEIFQPVKETDKQSGKKQRRKNQKVKVGYNADVDNELSNKVSQIFVTKEQVTRSMPTPVSAPQIASKPPPTRIFCGPILSQQSVDDLKKFELQERNLLVKRIEPHRLNVQKDTTCADERDEYHIIFVSSDPDWSYDITDLPLIVRFPEGYPKSAMVVAVEDDGTLPNILLKHCFVSINAWINEQHCAATEQDRVWFCFRDLLRWLDRNLEELFTQGLKKYQKQLQAAEAGVEFISGQSLKESYCNDEENNDGFCGWMDGDDESSDTTDDEQVEEIGDPTQFVKGSSEPTRRGTELVLRDLQLRGEIGTMRLTKARVQLRCQRCRMPQDLDLPADGNLRSQGCGRCGSAVWARFRGGTMHQYSAVAGYLDLKGCIVDDLVISECQFSLSCLACSREAALLGLAPGTLRTQWCQFCHAKQEVQLQNGRFTELQEPGLPIDPSALGLSLVGPKKKKREPREPAIKEGQPLPDAGICKHYRKSYRWLRFPCCGKVFPCDVCHDDASTDGHDMAFATRMLCGHCSKEQAYSSTRSCIACHKSLTRASSAHWEGGKGCRDIKKMSSKDSHKFHSLAKTVSKKAAAKAGAGAGAKAAKS